MRSSVELKDINGFVHLARAGTLTQAARDANLPKATLSQSLRRLEDTLSVELFIRSARGLTLTDSGRAYLENCQRIFDSCEMAASAAQRAHSSISGMVRIVASSEFGTSILGAATLYMAQENPGLDFEVRMYSGDTLIVDQPDFDCMIYVGTAPDSSFLCQKLGSVSYGIYASPAFLAQCGEIDSIDDVERMCGVEYLRHGIPEAWRLKQSGSDVTVRYERRFSVHDYWMAKYYAVSGVALAYLPDFFTHYEVAQGGLVPIQPLVRSDESSAWVIYPMTRHKNPRVKLVVQTLCEKFKEFIVHPGYALVPQATGNKDE